MRSAAYNPISSNDFCILNANLKVLRRILIHRFLREIIVGKMHFPGIKTSNITLESFNKGNET